MRATPETAGGFYFCGEEKAVRTRCTRSWTSSAADVKARVLNPDVKLLSIEGFTKQVSSKTVPGKLSAMQTTRLLLLLWRRFPEYFSFLFSFHCFARPRRRR